MKSVNLRRFSAKKIDLKNSQRKTREVTIVKEANTAYPRRFDDFFYTFQETVMPH